MLCIAKTAEAFRMKLTTNHMVAIFQNSRMVTSHDLFVISDWPISYEWYLLDFNIDIVCWEYFAISSSMHIFNNKISCFTKNVSQYDNKHTSSLKFVIRGVKGAIQVCNFSKHYGGQDWGNIKKDQYKA